MTRTSVIMSSNKVVSAIFVLALMLSGNFSAFAEDDEELLPLQRQDRMKRNFRVRERRRNLQWQTASLSFALRQDVESASTLLRGAGGNMTETTDNEVVPYSVSQGPEPDRAIP